MYEGERPSAEGMASLPLYTCHPLSSQEEESTERPGDGVEEC